MRKRNSFRINPNSDNLKVYQITALADQIVWTSLACNIKMLQYLDLNSSDTFRGNGFWNDILRFIFGDKMDDL
jgi:hypothetical protein